MFWSVEFYNLFVNKYYKLHRLPGPDCLFSFQTIKDLQLTLNVKLSLNFYCLLEIKYTKFKEEFEE